MKKFFMSLVWIAIVIIILYGISLLILPGNKRTRITGGTMEVKIEPGQKVMMATFKGNDLFYMTEPMDSGYVPKVKTLKEKSNYGIIEATVKFIESK